MVALLIWCAYAVKHLCTAVKLFLRRRYVALLIKPASVRLTKGGMSD